YEELLLYQAELYSLSSQIQKKSLEEWDAGNMEHLLHSIRVAIFSAKNLRDVTRDLENLEASEIKYFNERYIEFRKKMLRYYTSLSSQLNKKLSEEFVEADFTKLLDEVNEDDKKFLQTTLNFIAEFNPGRNDMSRLIVVNRSFVTSTREIISATREFSLLKNKDSV
ncbi:MAG: hypothetical protein KDK45_25835, partial [Leptospiraceae bacterium]|nr:hypothetical protein [Leptospiraceae bacterium]